MESFKFQNPLDLVGWNRVYYHFPSLVFPNSLGEFFQLGIKVAGKSNDRRSKATSTPPHSGVYSKITSLHFPIYTNLIGGIIQGRYEISVQKSPNVAFN